MFSQKLKELRKENGLTQTEFARVFNISAGTIGNWESGTRTPDTDMLKRIADFFNTSIDYLLGRDDNRFSFAGSQLKDEEFALIGEVRDLTPEEQKRVLDFIKFTKSQRGD